MFSMGMKKKVLAGGAIMAGAGLACAGTLAYAVATAYKRRYDRLRGKVVLITGGSRGLGLAMAEEFGRRGAKLALTARDVGELERARMLLLRKKAVANPEDIFISPGDLRDLKDAEEVIEQTTKHYGRIDILVNNAGIMTVGPVENQSAEDFRNVMNANFFSGLHCTLSVLPQMLVRREGSIVNIASIGGKIAVPHMLPYTASKFAAVGFSEGLHAELRSKGIRVTTVCPGLMRTGSHLNAQFHGDAEREYRWFSLGASLPLISTSARSAARQIVRSVACGRSEIVITPQAEFAARFGNLSPEITACVMKLTNLVLPAAVPAGDSPRPGAEARSLELTSLTSLGNSAARRYNQTQESAV
jgi:short-subunit dehydrogenase